jgi:hypothetical protein
VSRRLLTSLPAAAAATLLLAGCGPTEGEASPGAGSASSASASASAASATAAAASPSDAAGLATQLQQGVSGLTSAHLTIDVTSGSSTITGQGDEVLSGGRVTALDFSETVPGGGQIRVLQADGQTYVQLPADLQQSGKPWLLVTAESSNPVVAQLAASLQSVADSAQLDQFAAFTAAASDVTRQGTEQVDGAPATHWSLTVDVTKLPDTLAAKKTLVQAGVTSLPVDLWVDEKGRPVKVSEQITVQGTQASTVLTLGDFDAPVDVQAPPADQVATG